MNAFTPEVMKTPKSYWSIRRNDGHSDWTFGFWRELFQNEVDAGAKNISITVAEADGKGSFGRDATSDRVLRVTFSGDGKGMDEKVIRDVFLRPGESTKRGTNAQGGFGTARIMLCFSQVRYGIRTQDLVVEGDGSEYTVERHQVAIESRLGMLAAAEASHAQAKEMVTAAEAEVARLGAEQEPEAPELAGEARKRAEAASEALVAAHEAAKAAAKRETQIRADLAALQGEPENRRGARFEIDIDPDEHEYRYRNVTVEKLLTKLDDYLSMSQLSCKVTVNGSDVEVRALRGPAKRKLVATMDDGSEVEFGTIHTSQGDRAKHKGKVIVRSGGAAMFHQSTSASTQVIVELEPALSKQVLTDNRDGMKEPYRSALDGFIEELVVDTKSALDDKEKRRHIVVKGGLGTLRASLARVDLGRERRVPDGVVGAEPDALAPELPKAIYTTAEEYEVQGWGGVPKPVVDRLLEAVAKGDETLLDNIDGHELEKARFVEAARGGAGGEALREVEGPLADRLAAALAERVRDAGAEVGAAADAARFSDLNDVHIQVDDIGDDEKLKNAVRRHNPGYWRRKGEHLEGRGMEAHMLYAAWTACVTHALRAAMAAEPSLGRKGHVDYATGWYFGRAQERWNGDNFGKARTAAQHQEHEGAHLILVNPVLEDGRAAFDLTKLRRDEKMGPDGKEAPMGLQDLVALAVHEVCHIFKKKHDEDFASLMTRTMAMFDQAGAFRAMREAVDTARAAYGRGRTRIQAMDGPELETVLEAEEEKPAKAAKAAKAKGGRREPRPAERLLAHAAPVSTMVAGAALAPENEGLPVETIRDAYAAAFEDKGEGVTEVNCDLLQGLEAQLAETARAGWESPLGLDDGPGLSEVPVAALGGLDGALTTLAASPLEAADLGSLGGLGDQLAALADLAGPHEVQSQGLADPLAGLGGDLAALAEAPGLGLLADAPLGFPEEVPATAPPAAAAVEQNEQPDHDGAAPLLGADFDASDFGLDEGDEPAPTGPRLGV